MIPCPICKAHAHKGKEERSRWVFTVTYFQSRLKSKETSSSIIVEGEVSKETVCRPMTLWSPLPEEPLTFQQVPEKHFCIL